MSDRAWRLSLVGLVLLPTAMLYPVWFHPTSAGEDDAIYYMPLRVLVGRALTGGEVDVLHHPYQATGAPLMSDPQSAVLSPPTWLFAAVDAELAYALSVFGAFSLAGLGAAAYLRSVGIGREAALIGAVAFMFCGYMVGHRVHLAMIQTAGFLPWILLALEAVARRRRGAAAGLTLAAALALAAGHWPTILHMSLVVMGYALLRVRPLVVTTAKAAGATLVAAMLVFPQVLATGRLLAEATRSGIGYAMAGENSFFPAAGVLALFPFLMGNRTPNVFSQPWWGVWHLCEMLGYVGLVTLVLAGAAVLGARRARRRGDRPMHGSLVRTWSWLAVGAGVFALGYYLPTYRLIHALPGLRVARCPARMLLAVDLALAVLAAVTIDSLIRRAVARRHESPAGAPDGLGQAVRGLLWALPAVMVAALCATAVIAAGVHLLVPWPIPLPFAGSAGDALRAVVPTNPAVWVPMIVCAATVATGLWWLRRPADRWPMVLVLLLADLLVLTRFVDVPADLASAENAMISPAAAFLAERAEADRPGGEAGAATGRVWGLSETYHDRPAELLLPMTSAIHGLASISTYGPWQSAEHARVLGFRITGECRSWETLVRRNHLLSLYGVRYLLAADADRRRVIESVRTPDGPRPPTGANVVDPDRWQGRASVGEDGVLRLRTPVMWSESSVSQRIGLAEAGTYRITMEVRGPAGGAANHLIADVMPILAGRPRYVGNELALVAHPEQVTGDWRRFEWWFDLPAEWAGPAELRIHTQSERPIEVRSIALCPAPRPVPLAWQGRLPAGSAVYRDLTPGGLEPRREGEPRVHVYENRLWRRGRDVTVLDEEEVCESALERLKFDGPLPGPEGAEAVVDVSLGTGLQVSLSDAGSVCLVGAGLLAAMCGYGVFAGRRGARKGPS